MGRPRQEIEADMARLAVELRRRSNALLDLLGIDAPPGLRAMLSRDAVTPIEQALARVKAELDALDARLDEAVK